MNVYSYDYRYLCVCVYVSMCCASVREGGWGQTGTNQLTHRSSGARKAKKEQGVEDVRTQEDREERESLS